MKSDVKLALILSLIFSAIYVYAWNYYHPRLHHCSFGKNTADEKEQLNAYEKWIRRNHTLHHLQKGSKKGNSNILVPLADHLLGKYNVCVDHEYFLSEKQGELSKSEQEITDAFNNRLELPYDTHFCYNGAETGFTRLL